MTDQSDERLSSLVDGELGDTDHHQALTSLISDEKRCQCWERYHLIGDTLKRNLPHAIDCQLASRVMAELENEPTILAPQTHKSSFGKRMAGLAVAASVATVAVLGVQFMYQEDGSAPAQQMAHTSSDQLPAQKQNLNALAKKNFTPRGIQTVTQSFEQSPIPSLDSNRVLPRMHKYFLDHNQRASRGVVQGVMPYARIITNAPSQNVANQKQILTEEQIQR